MNLKFLKQWNEGAPGRQTARESSLPAKCNMNKKQFSDNAKNRWNKAGAAVDLGETRASWITYGDRTQAGRQAEK
jgi:hypothetical protein